LTFAVSFVAVREEPSVSACKNELHVRMATDAREQRRDDLESVQAK
jgi:hypothetical protein